MQSDSIVVNIPHIQQGLWWSPAFQKWSGPGLGCKGERWQSPNLIWALVEGAILKSRQLGILPRLLYGSYQKLSWWGRIRWSDISYHPPPAPPFSFSAMQLSFFFLCYAWASTISPWHCALCLLYSAFPGYLCTLVLWQERTIVLLRSRPHKPRLGMTGLNSYPLSKVLYSLRTYLESVGKIMGN